MGEFLLKKSIVAVFFSLFLFSCGDKFDSVAVVEKYLGVIPENNFIALDHTDTRDGKEYDVLKYFEIVTDDPETGKGHTSTIKWFYVDKKTAQIYEWDLVTDKLKLVK